MLFDLHVHSCFSKDSDSDLDSILKWAKINGLDGLAICDHDSVEGGVACSKRAEELDCDILVIPGIEVSSAEGHVLIIGVNKAIPPGLSVPETIICARE
ncbi:PHP domain-containing protein [Methanohalophilus sp.]|uniref:PHP domain-containing protein n=1 Tax=Methanohalophilus sp. TaxID=1966352 RepID=UPI003436F104